MTQELMKINLCSAVKKDDVQTPRYLYEVLDEIYHFDHDPCPYMSSDKTGLEEEWGNMNFVNPPYSDIAPWVRKAIYSLMKGKKTVMLVPVRTSSRYWQDLIFPYATSILFLDKTIVFDGYKNSCPFPLAILEFMTPGIKQKITAIETNHTIRKRTKATVKFYRYGPISNSLRSSTTLRGSRQKATRTKRRVAEDIQRADRDPSNPSQRTEWNGLSFIQESNSGKSGENGGADENDERRHGSHESMLE